MLSEPGLGGLRDVQDFLTFELLSFDYLLLEIVRNIQPNSMRCQD